ncbi:hypothetical protein L2U69_18500 [Zavarzinia compransoris]|uniref:hypothetical protein n=1 Tax=Zavarzinia marina TaxID=2911065 RepID=UPI001F31CDC8|nr:hypothetical protein [Zavarzinia marina]MCF4167643.1 hypothetical protein [Zavarzinia marina]
MPRKLHPAAGGTALGLIACFWVATVIAEIGGDAQDIYRVKTGILYALVLLIPAIVYAGLSGRRLAGRSPDPRIAAKKRRMPVIALNGGLVLVPCAIYLQMRAAVGDFTGAFWWVQGLELAAGALNITLLGLSLKDGKAIARQRRRAMA